MKRAYNLLTEILALPFSELFLFKDPLLKAVKETSVMDGPVVSGKNMQRLTSALDNAFFDVTEYLNRHTDVIHLTMVQSAFNHVYNAHNIMNHVNAHPSFKSPEELLTLYYLESLGTLAKLFLVGRNGHICVRPESFLKDALEYEATQHPTFRIENADKKYQGIELWNSMLRCLPEELIISSFVAQQAHENEKIHSKRDTCDQLLSGTDDTVRISDPMLDKVLEKGLAETHVHAGASRSFGIIWDDMLRQAMNSKPVLEKERYCLPFKESITEKKTTTLCVEAAIVQIILAAFLMSNTPLFSEYLKEAPFIPRCNCQLQKEIVEIKEFNQPKYPLSTYITPGDCFLKAYPGYTIPELWKILGIPAERSCSCPTLAQKTLLCRSFLHVLNKPEDAFFNALFLYYIRLYCVAYRARVQDSKSTGLSYFQRYYDASTDTGSLNAEEKLREILYTAMRDTRICKTELRFAPPKIYYPTLDNAVTSSKAEIINGIVSFIKNHVYTLILFYSEDAGITQLGQKYEQSWRDALRRIKSGKMSILISLLNEYGVRPEHIPPHRLGIIYHLIKYGEAGEETSCALNCLDERSEFRRYASFSFGKARFQYLVSVAAITDLRNRYPSLRSLLVGLDAASLEIPTEPWVFAPAFHEARMRDGALSLGGQALERQKQLGFTYHVGEDFYHPLSGLRHVDEAVSYLEMRTGDRIGHGLVLGINMADWFYRNHLVIMPQIEWLENNLWIWDMISREPELSSLSPYLNEIKRQIFDSARMIYGTLDGISLEALIHAYKTKFTSTEYLESIAKKESAHLKKQGDCFQMLDSAKCLPCLCASEYAKCSGWTENALVLSYHCGVFKQRMAENILIKPSESQAEIATQLQQFLVKKIASLGLIVEANPSSNAVIGEMDGVLMHPIYQLRSDESYHVMTSVNTDDPSVFCSSVANEYAQIYYTLRYHGKSTEDALKEIDLIRKIGVETSFLSSPPPIGQLISEYEVILSSILS